MIHVFLSPPRHPVAGAGRVPWRSSTLLIALWAAACESPVAPTACGQLPQVTVNVGETSSVAACFDDANGDLLSYMAASSNPAVATASISGASITVAGVAPGNTTVTVTATDPEGLQGQSSFAVTVPNRAPQPRGTMPNVTVQVGSTTTVAASQYFSEPDGETLAYAASSSDDAVASVSVAGSVVTVTAEAKGDATINVTASDPGGLSANHSFRFTVPNRPPAPVGAVGAQTIEVGQSVTLDIAASFTDPDGDALTYTASSSIAAVARTSVSGSTVTITAAGPGTTTITITASDDDRATATQQLTVTVPQPNRAPLRVGSIPAQTIDVGRRATVNASRYFSDPDGDVLTYSATSSISSVARTSVSGSTVTITGASAGSATITVTARDPEGLTATQQARVTVSQPNRAPRPVGTIPPQTTNVGGRATVNASQYFSDPDNDVLTYSATSSNSGVARTSVSGSTVTITGASAGSATITVTARDPEGLTATQQARVTVSQPNRAPRPVGSIPSQTITAGETSTVNASSYFSDPDGDRLTYTARSSRTSAATASVSGSQVTVTAVAQGSATVRITATDPDDLSAEQSFTVTVQSGGGGGTRTYQTGETISTLPTGFWTPDVTSGASFQFSGGQVTISFNSGGYIEEAGTRYTCRASGGCRIVNRVVTQGTIEASGGGGGGGSNRAPAPRGSISDRTITVGETSTVNASSYFSDPDGDRLTYTARSSRTSAATVSVSASRVTVTAVAQGSATVRITATDPDGLSAEQSFTVTVQSGGGGGTRTYQTGETISTLPTGFWTPDVTSGASFQFSSGQVTISFNNGGYIEEAGIRYTCRTSGGCRVVNRVVTQGTIEAAGGGGGGTGQAASGEITSCRGVQIAPGIPTYRITIEGTVRANRTVSFVIVTGYANGQTMGVAQLGSIAAGQSKNFSVGGLLAAAQPITTVTCTAKLEYQTSGSTAGQDLLLRTTVRDKIGRIP